MCRDKSRTWRRAPCPCRPSAIPGRETRRRRRSLRHPASIRLGGRRGNLMLHAADELADDEPVGHRDRIADGPGARAAMPDDGDAGRPEKRRAAVLRVVDALTKV